MDISDLIKSAMDGKAKSGAITVVRHEDSGAYDQALDDAASSAFKAIKDDDEDAFKEALIGAIKVCMDPDEEEEEEEPEEE